MNTNKAVVATAVAQGPVVTHAAKAVKAEAASAAKGKEAAKAELPVLVERGISKLDVDRLDTSLRKQVLTLEKRLVVAIEAVGRSQLAVGKVLFEIRELLKPLKLWVLYLNRMPWMAPATAERYVTAYERGHNQLSPAVVEIAISQGVPLFGTSEERPFGKLTDAVAAMPPAPKDSEAAGKWIADLRVKQRELRPERPTVHPIDRLVGHVVDLYLKDHEEHGTNFKEWIAELTKRIEALIRKRASERLSEAR